jgi:hypothetical protein
MLGRQQRMILLVKKDQQGQQTINNNNKEKYLYPYALRGCVRPLRIVPLKNLCCAARSFLITPIFTNQGQRYFFSRNFLGGNLLIFLHYLH